MSNNHCLFSVIIPVFNNAQYIKQTLDSVFAQIDSDVEVIIINDGSTDKTQQILEEFQKKYANIILENQENFGEAISRNKAIFFNFSSFGILRPFFQSEKVDFVMPVPFATSESL